MNSKFEKPLIRRMSVPWPVYLGAAFVLLFCGLYAYFGFDGVPHIHDEMCYLFQAQTLQMGRLYVPSPCAPASFDFPHMINNGRYYSMYTPGFPLLLLIGLPFKVPWLVNPLFAALSIFLLYFLGAEIYDRTIGLLAAVLSSVSIWLLLMSATMMSHTTSMFFNGLFLLFFFKSVRRPTVWNGALAGASWGMALLIRPGNTPLFSLPFLFVLGILLLRDFKRRFKNAASLAAAAVVFIGLLLAYNQLTNGNPFTMGYIVHHGKEYGVIFGRPATLDYNFGPLAGAVQIWDNFKAINGTLFGWPLSSLLALLPLLWAVKTKPREVKKDLLLLSGFMSMVAGFFFFWGAFVFLGARMLFDGLPILVMLSAKGVRESVPLLISLFKKKSAAFWSKAVAMVLAVFTLYAFFIRLPRWVRPPETEYYYERYDRTMAGSSTSIHNAVTSLGLHQAVVVMKFLYTPLSGFPTGWWSSGFCYNTPKLDGDVIYALDRGEKNAELFRCFPGRKIYLYAGTLEKGLLVSLKNDGGRVVAGEPLRLEKRLKKSAELVVDPIRLYKPYSTEFLDFLEGVYREPDSLTMDVEQIKELGTRYARARDFRRAAFCFEAALQLENSPKPRLALLNMLVPCYLKTGQVREAKVIMDKMEKADWMEFKLFSILPERGF
ncbi:MAG: glycosyltransferase family 39 protein [Candidatus Aminicenantes bacterium]|nr:glycosyltransferase family 39 protein [Candidatus Aminicenantes bacterium]